MRIFAWALAPCLTVVAATAATPAFAANVLPDATFGSHPSAPETGQQVRLTSYGCDPDGRLARQDWDLNGDGVFEDASGRTVLAAFPAGRHTVRLRVTDRLGAVATRSRTIDVLEGDPIYADLPAPFRPSLLSPFPIVRVAGTVIGTGARIRLLTVRAPICSRVTVRCRGADCPWRRRTRLVARRALRISSIQRHLEAGTVVEVLVSKRDRIGKYTRFRIREGRPPARRDLCLAFRATRGTRCPSD